MLIIASMIEREAAVAKDRRLISAVIYNRLRQHMPLGIDATMRYGLDNWTRPLQAVRARDATGLQHAHAPGPAADADRQPGPGVDQGRGRARRNVPYLYYVVKPCGNGAHAFSSTDAQFQRDVAAYNRKRDAARRQGPVALLSADDAPRRPRLAGGPQPLAGDAQRRARGARARRLALPAAAGPARGLRGDRRARCRRAGFVGANVTIPHKEAALALADQATDAARAIGAANTLTLRRGRRASAPTTPTRRACSPRCRRRRRRADARSCSAPAGARAPSPGRCARRARRAVAVWNRTARARARRWPRSSASAPSEAAERRGPAGQLHARSGWTIRRHVQGPAASTPMRSGTYATVVDLVYRAERHRAHRRSASAGMRGRRRARDPGPPGRAELRGLDGPGGSARRDAATARVERPPDHMTPEPATHLPRPSPATGRDAPAAHAPAPSTNAPTDWDGVTPPRRTGGGGARFLTDVIVELGFVGPRARRAGGRGRARDRARRPSGCCSSRARSARTRWRARSPSATASTTSTSAIFHVDMGGGQPHQRRRGQALRGGPGRASSASAALLVAMADPANVLAVDDIALMTGYEVRVAVASREDIAALISRLTRLDDVVGRRAEIDRGRRRLGEIVDLRESADDAPVIKLVNQIIAQAVEQGASDIHFEPDGTRDARALPHRRRARRDDDRPAAHGQRRRSPA